ncbi:MAG: helicase-related protein [Gordonia sp. (in: high G+C Gram-positive bacteria)]
MFTAAPGSIVFVRDEDWLVTATEETPDGHLVHVTGLSELVRDAEAVFSTALDDVVEADPSDVQVIADLSPKFRQARLWLDAMVRKTPVAIGDPSLEMSRQALADPLDYQLKAVSQTLDGDKVRPRVLIADAVGLGKTIEIGMILSELTRRGRGDRILVVTPKHVLEQMQMELWTRFAIPLVRLDSAGIQRIRQVLPANRNPFTYYKRVIISIDTLKSDKYVAHLRQQRWDAVVIDESHNVTNATALKSRLARLLAAHTDALILASATPHNGKPESFAELLRLLDPTLVSPSGEADLKAAAKYVIRRHRHSPEVASEVGSQWAERRPPENIEVQATAAEDAIARELEQVWLWPESGSSPYSGKNSSLFPWTLAKAYLSSPAALAATVSERRNRLDHSKPGTAAETAALDRLAELTEAVPLAKSAKYQELLKYLKTVGVGKGSDERVVIFSERIPTLNALAEQLTSDLKFAKTKPGALGPVTVLHGRLSDVEQQTVVESFKLESSPIRILVTGDVASEGVNLHSQCHRLVHFDIPWSLIRIEQRNGRIDRYGQTTRPQITALLLSPSTERFGGDFRVLARLIEREHEAHNALGESSSLIGTYDVKAEEEALRQVINRDREFADTVKDVAEVAEGDDIEAFLAILGGLGAQPNDAPETSSTVGASVYPSDFEFLADAIGQAYETPEQKAPNGVGWAVHETSQIAEIVPPKDLRQRLQVLPQDYLRDRRVTEKFKLAYTEIRGQDELSAARSGDSTSAWPEAHFLAPLHPILDWAADRALAKLGRSEIFAVRGDVPVTTVLVQSTQTNARGQVVGASYSTVAFLDVEKAEGALVTPYADAATAISALQISSVNRGDITDAERMQPLIRAAVAQLGSVADGHAEAIRQASSKRIDAWITRVDEWQADAALFSSRWLQDQANRVAEEKTLARAMEPAQRLIRPLLVVVPENA